ncbi:hypothetical protein BJ085DRAFT_36914 [Dimargaris cristalligena]|uniref:WHIM1 domain-containing protein n=1 Tax=Dimargaris cristalligena TaxID=215637 RepID=A0A4V1J4B8_9FUNG|nr:hypothetical protein BJ085DRAFT_36914 [Dimargaris cristalligena]|eukprot:RKP35009.1 hypothetical protein BJ085DRAFT_36914 [Dimargaris cristalligena]
MTVPESTVKHQWQFAFVQGFYSRFGFLFKDFTFDPNEFEVALQSDQSELLQTMICDLLQLARTDRGERIGAGNWQNYLRAYLAQCQGSLPWQLVESPMAFDGDFNLLDSQHKLLIIWGLCETLLQNNPDIHKYIESRTNTNLNKKGERSDPIMVEPFFIDHQHKYYYFNDGHPWLYRQTDPHEPNCRWEAVTSSEDEFNDFISSLGTSSSRYDKLLYRRIQQAIRPEIDALALKKRQQERARLKTAMLHNNVEILSSRTRTRNKDAKYTFGEEGDDEF